MGTYNVPEEELIELIKDFILTIEGDFTLKCFLEASKKAFKQLDEGHSHLKGGL